MPRTVTILRWAFRALLIACAGLIHALSWTRPGFWPGAWIGHALLIVLAVRSSPRVAFASGVAVGCLGIGWSFSWAPASLMLCLDASWWGAHLVYGILVVWESLVIAVFAGLVSYFARFGLAGLWVAPLVWVVAEFWCPRIFPWLLGYTQLELLPLIQIAEFTGSTGVGCVMTVLAMVPAAIALWSQLPRRRAELPRLARFVAGAVMVFGGVWLWGMWRLQVWEERIDLAPDLKVGLVQVDPTIMGSEAKLRQRSAELCDRVDLVCWPESAIGNYCWDLPDFRDTDRTMRLSRDSRESLRPAEGFPCDLLAGGKTYRAGAGEEGPYAMTAFLIDPRETIIGRYCKRTLLPFGEYMPGQQYFPQLREWATLYEVIEAGRDPRPIRTSRGDRVGVLICYEDILPRNVRPTVTSGAQVLVSLINAAAFKSPLTLEQHQRLAWMRAVENRRFFVRCSSTGVSCIISPTGRIVRQLAVGVESVLESQIKLLDELTVYAAWGEFFPWCCSAMVLVAWLGTRRRRRGGGHARELSRAASGPCTSPTMPPLSACGERDAVRG